MTSDRELQTVWSCIGIQPCPKVTVQRRNAVISGYPFSSNFGFTLWIRLQHHPFHTRPCMPSCELSSYDRRRVVGRSLAGKTIATIAENGAQSRTTIATFCHDATSTRKWARRSASEGDDS